MPRLALASLTALALLAVPSAAAAAPALSAGDVTVTEGDTGAGTATFTVTMSETSATPVTVQYATADDTARQPGDYTATSGTLTIPPGMTSNTVLVPVKGDTLDEVDERFVLNLSSATGATIADSTGTGTIKDDDPAPTLSVTDASRTEGNVDLSFTVRLSTASGRDVSVDYATADESARAGADYNATSGRATIPAGSTTATVRVRAREDTLDEPSETLRLHLSNPSGATVSDSSGLGTIVDDDAAPSISIRDASAREGQPAGLVVALSRASGRTITVRFASEPGTAASGSDYTAVSGTLTFAPGTTSATIFAATVADALDERNETFRVRLSRATNARISDGTATATIVDDDPPPNARPRLNLLRVRPFAFPATARVRPLIRFVLSEPARVTFFAQRRTARGVWVRVPGGFARAGRAGANRLRLPARIGGRRLAPGRYRLVAVAADRQGARSFVRRAGFRVAP
ncbi:MAG: hypothetical protein QOE65_1086 [Solirubrobacteraceae bacterium]|jgi:hypothetical protein|nr:hypothetical protein [Solirubrobacteraceae bacterium]